MTDTRRPTPEAKHVTHLLSSYLDDQVNDAEREQIERHLATCPACRTELAQLRLIVSTMRATPALEPPRSFVLTPEMVRRPSWLSLWSTYSPAIAAIAAVLLVAILFADLFLVSGQGGALAPAAPALTEQLASTDAAEQVMLPHAQFAEESAGAAATAPAETPAPAATVAAAAPAQPTPGTPEPEEAMLAAPADVASTQVTAETEAEDSAAPLALEAPGSSQAYSPDRRGPAAPSLPEETGAPRTTFGLAAPPEAAGPASTATLSEPLATMPPQHTSAPEEDTAAAQARKAAAEAASGFQAEVPSSPEDVTALQPPTRTSSLRQALRIAEVGLSAVLILALGTWGAQLISRRGAARR